MKNSINGLKNAFGRLVPFIASIDAISTFQNEVKTPVNRAHALSFCVSFHQPEAFHEFLGWFEFQQS